MINTNKTPEQIRDEHRVIFYALMESAMRYRENFWREDCDIYEKGLQDAYSITKEYQTASFTQRRKYDARVKNMAIENRRKNEAFNAGVYEAIEAMETQLSPENKGRFDNYATAFGLMCEELAKARNTTEIITVCKLYNEGAFDHLFTPKMPPYEQEVIVDGDHLRTGSDAF